MAERLPSPYSPSQDEPLQLFLPILASYHNHIYSRLETSIFPGFFHGKCRDDKGNVPDGCPNPDCPVVCGTPGSMCHFYPKLRYIAFNATRHLISDLASPGTDEYLQVEKRVMHAVFGDEEDDTDDAYQARRDAREGVKTGEGNERRMLRFERWRGVARKYKRDSAEMAQKKKAVKKELQDTLAQAGPMLEKQCGGSGNGQTNGLPECDWADLMKEFILTFP